MIYLACRNSSLSTGVDYDMYRKKIELRQTDRAPIILLLANSVRATSIARFANARGWICIVAPWQQANAVGCNVSLTGAYSVLANGQLVSMGLQCLITPALLGVIEDHTAALERGRAIAAVCGAMWAHLPISGLVAGWPSDDTHDLVGVIVGSKPAWSPLQAVSSVVLSTKKLNHAGVSEQLTQRLETLNASLAPGDPIVHLICAPFVFHGVDRKESDLLLRAPLTSATGFIQRMLSMWLDAARQRTTLLSPIHFYESNEINASEGNALTVNHFPTFFGTQSVVHTTRSPGTKFVFLDPRLEPIGKVPLAELLCRRRTNGVDTPHDQDSGSMSFTVETGVGRACLIENIRVAGAPYFHDFTLLGVGLTPYSEGGFVEIGREIDGKAALLRAWHRQKCSARLETEGCRVARVVALAQVESETMVMPGGTLSPAALVVRAFRCVLRVKQLDPIVCALHSPQHTPLVADALIERVRELRVSHPINALSDQNALAWAAECQPASQASLRELVTACGTSVGSGWPAAVRDARLSIIDAYAPRLIALARRRLSMELGFNEAHLDNAAYLEWFAESLGCQLRNWRRLRFLHDYHHPGISRWRPGTLYSLGENNVTLLAEFADLDTGIFVDDPDESLRETLQLEDADLALLRSGYATWHLRDIEAAQTVVRTFAGFLFRNQPSAADAAAQRLRMSYDYA